MSQNVSLCLTRENACVRGDAICPENRGLSLCSGVKSRCRRAWQARRNGRSVRTSSRPCVQFLRHPRLPSPQYPAGIRVVLDQLCIVGLLELARLRSLADIGGLAVEISAVVLVESRVLGILLVAVEQEPARRNGWADLAFHDHAFTVGKL